MNDEFARSLLEEVRRVRELLTLLAEPAIAQRDSKLRAELKRIVGSSKKKQSSVLLMDGSRTQAQIAGETGVHKGDLSTMITKLKAAALVEDGGKRPKLSISILANFFDDEH